MRDRRKACRNAVRRTGFCVSWPDLGLCPSFVGGHFFCSPNSFPWSLLPLQLNKEKISPVLDPIQHLAMMNLAHRRF
jgi:hypothetical protein